MNITNAVRINLDTLAPDLARKAAALRDLTPVAVAAAGALQSWAERAFDDPGMRMTTWAPRKTGGAHALLKKSGALQMSFRVEPGSGGKASIVSDRPYAAAHQFGRGPYTIKPKTKKGLWWPGAKHPVMKVNHPGFPARPFFPVNAQGVVWPAAQVEVLEAAEAAVMALLNA